MPRDEDADILAGQLERLFAQVAFFSRVRLEDLALVYPEARRCKTKEEFLAPHVRALRTVVELGLIHAPAEVGRLVDKYPEVGRLLRRPQGETDRPTSNAPAFRADAAGVAGSRAGR